MRKRLGVAVAVATLVAGCATRTAPPPVGAPAYPEFMFPTVPSGAGDADLSSRLDVGWRFLQANDLRSADREFAAALTRSSAFYPARTATGYVALARKDSEQALAGFDAALKAAPTYVPALVGRGQALLALNRDAAALAAFEAALAADPSLADVRQRVDVLRFRALEDLIAQARAALGANRLDEAAAAYERALAASPDSAFLHRELGSVERRQGRTDAALTRFQRAVELEPSDAALHTQIGELLEARQDFAGAEAAYRRAAELEPTPELTSRIAAVGERGRDANLPAEFRAILNAMELTRGDLAALIGIRLDDVLRTAAPREVVMTDTAGHWAAPWITQVAQAGVIDPFENHTFQPRSRITRADLAGAVSRLVALLAARRADLRGHLTERPKIADVPPGHLSYPAVAVAVASGTMPLAAEGRFEVARPVSGAEAASVIGRVQALASSR